MTEKRLSQRRSLGFLLPEIAVSLVVYGMMTVPLLLMWELSLQHASDTVAPADSNRATFAINVEREGQRIVGEAKCADAGDVPEPRLCLTPEIGSPLVQTGTPTDTDLINAGICDDDGSGMMCDAATSDHRACFWVAAPDDTHSLSPPPDPRSQHRVACWVLRLPDQVDRLADPSFAALLDNEGRLEIVELIGECSPPCDHRFASQKDGWMPVDGEDTVVVAWGLLDDGNTADAFTCRSADNPVWRECDDPSLVSPTVVVTGLKVSVCFRLPFWRIPTVNSPTCTPASTSIEIGG